MKIVYEDNHLLALDKPPGLLTQPSGRDGESLEGLAKEFLKTRDHKPGEVFLEAIHRLDRAASGIVIFAKTSKALSRLMASIRKGEFEKHYLAWVENALPAKEGSLEDTLLHSNHRSQVVPPETPGAKHASLSYKELKRKGGQTLYQIKLDTGRYHQIRIQFASRRCPIMGDIKYGASLAQTGILLHHTSCTLPHPTLKTPLTLKSPPQYKGWHA